MSTAVVAAMISLGMLMCAALVAAGTALWRLGTKVGTFELLAANAASTALQAVDRAEAASREAEAAGNRLFAQVQSVTRELMQEVETLGRRLTVVETDARDVQRTVHKLRTHETRLAVIEREHDRNHRDDRVVREQSRPYPIPQAEDVAFDESAVPSLIDADVKPKKGGNV